MIPSFFSGFSQDIQRMMEWRGILGYARTCYSQEMVSFDRYCQKEFPEADTLTWEIALSYLNDTRERKDVKVDVAALRNLGKYQIMVGKEACVFPTNYFSYKKKSLPYIMNEEECRRFFEATDHYPYNKQCPLLTYTVAVFYRLQYSTGMRPQEVRHLTRQDFDFIHDTIYIADSKHHKDRCIAVRHSVMEMCRKYDIIARKIYPNTTVFFPNRNGNEHDSASIGRYFQKCWEQAGNPTPSENVYCSPYILRHNFATQTIIGWMENGKDFEKYLPYLSTYMGHETFRETCYYLHLIPERISKMPSMDISDIISGVAHEK